jgi:anti-sigma factor RsiW
LADKKKIGFKDGAAIDEEYLLHYLDGTMPPDQQHMLEELMDTDPFLSDAVEGLASVKDKEQLKIITAQLNNQLKKLTEKRRERRNRKKLTDHWGWIFVIVILLLVVLGWLVIHMMLAG